MRASPVWRWRLTWSLATPAELLLALGRVEHERNPDAAGAALRAALDLAGSDLRLTVELLVQLAAVEYILGRRR